MDENKIVSIEEYFLKRSNNLKMKEKSPITAVLMQDLREQQELIHWYTFHNMVNKHKLFVHSLFTENRGPAQNLNSGYVVCYNKELVEFNTEKILEAIRWEGREPVLLNAAGRTIRQLGEDLPWISGRNAHDVYKAIKELLLYSDKIVVIRELSKLKAADNKQGWARSFIKILDDAHFDGIKPRANLIFVDYADFLQKVFDQIGIYLNILG